MFWKRFVSGAVILALCLIFCIFGGPVLAIGLGVLSGIAYIEFTKASGVRAKGSKINAFEIIGLIEICAYYLLLLLYEIVSVFPQSLSDWLFKSVGFFTNYSVIMLLVFMIGVISILCAYIFNFPKFNNNQVAGAVFGLIYTTFMMSFVYYTREIEDKGVFLVWLIFITSWVSDTCAYFVGSAIGKHKMTPNLSPKKSYEGAVGGILGSIIASGLYGLYYRAHFGLSYTVIISFCVIGAVGAFISMCGDLVASAVKRNNDVKDYGKIIPGHGGILDRFDSVLFTAPMVYFLIVLLIKL